MKKMGSGLKSIKMEDAIKDKRRVLFGTNLNSANYLVLTPISKIYDKFIRTQKEYQGWWRTKRLNEGAYVIKCPLGVHVEDVVYYAPKVDNIILLGYCGSCNPSIKVGSLFSASFAQQDSEIINSTYHMEGIKSGKVYQVASLHEQEEKGFIEKMKMKVVDCIDMETYSVFNYAKVKAKGFGSIYVVTDNLIDKQFYKTNAQDRRLIDYVLEEVVQNILVEIENAHQKI